MSGGVLIVTWDGGGNTAPAIALGARLRARGRRVTMLGWSSMRSRAESAGLAFHAYRSVPPWPPELPHEADWDRLTLMLHSARVAREVVTVAESSRPDTLVIDCMMGAAFTAAEHLGLRTVTLVHVLYQPYVRDWGDGFLRADARALLAATERVLALTPPGLDEAGELPANTFYAGAIGPPARSEGDDLDRWGLEHLAAPGDPWVLLSLGTTLQGQVAALPTMVEAVASLPVRVLLTLGGVVPPGVVQPPPNVTVRDVVPHEVVLPRMSAAVSHGGLSTITAALAAGVPLVCIPQGRDQPLNAARVQAAGAGLSVPPESSAATIASALDTLLCDRGIRDTAGRFARATAELGHGRRAVDEVEQLLLQGQTSAAGRR